MMDIDESDETQRGAVAARMAKETTVSSRAEVDAIGSCCGALEPIAHDKMALRRVYDYLQARFPPHNPRPTRGRGSEYD